MAALSHLDPDFASVAAIEAVNEPIMDATQTPGYGDCMRFSLSISISTLIHRLVQKNFVKVVRAVEEVIGIIPRDSSSSSGLLSGILSNALNVTASLLSGKSYGGAVGEALVDAAPILVSIAAENGVDGILTETSLPSRTPLVTTYV